MAAGSFPDRRPYTFVALLELTIIGVYLLAGTVDHFLRLGGLGVYALANAALVLILALVATRLGWWHRIGFRRASAATLVLVLPMLLPAVLNVFPGLAFPGLPETLGFLALALGVGFVEETAFRGLMLRALEPRGLWRAIIITTVLFSVTHLMNILAGEGGLQAVMQLLYSAAIGFAFTALVLRTGVIWPLIVAHALIDFVVFLRAPGAVLAPTVEIAVDLAVTVVFVVFGLLVLRGGRGRLSQGLPAEPDRDASPATAGRAD